VHGYALATAREYGMDAKEIPDLENGVLLHDIGKIGIPDAVLLKPSKLTVEEWKVMRTHPEIGKRLIENVPFLRNAIPVVYCHHEKFDGSGYPRGLKGVDIPLAARIFSVADAFDAMTFDRPYSTAISFEAAKTEIRRCTGSHFDPTVVESFFRVPEDLLSEIRRKSTEPRTSLP
jgi:HD-GYP domain-containing protein (c-di-GMP phosphodiesterase class II)